MFAVFLGVLSKSDEHFIFFADSIAFLSSSKRKKDAHSFF
jgi:hypothetical protein